MTQPLQIQVGDVCIALRWHFLVEITHVITERESRAVALCGGPIFQDPSEVDTSCVQWKDYIFTRQRDANGKEMVMYIPITPSQLERIGRMIDGSVVIEDEFGIIPETFFRKPPDPIFG